jgi:hypothetical protein
MAWELEIPLEVCMPSERDERHAQYSRPIEMKRTRQASSFARTKVRELDVGARMR